MVFLIWALWVIVLIVCFHVAIEADKRYKKLIALVLIIWATAGYCIWGSQYDGTTIHQHKRNVTIEVREKYVNGELVKSDTVYVFERQKKEKK